MCFSVVPWLIKSCRSMDSAKDRVWGNTSRGWARRCQWRKPASVGARLLLETQRKRVRSHPHTHTDTNTQQPCTSSHIKDSWGFFLFLFFVSSVMFVFNSMCCHLRNHVPTVWVYHLVHSHLFVFVSASASTQNLPDPHGSNSGLILFYFLFPISIIDLQQLFVCICMCLYHPHEHICDKFFIRKQNLSPSFL